MRLRMPTSFLLALIFVTLSVSGFAGNAKDARRLPISPEEVKSAARNLPLSSPQHHVLISRAGTSGFQRLAYEEYLRLKKQHPNDFHANLLCGVAAKIYLDWLTHPDTRKGRPLSRSEIKLIFDVQNTARTCLKKALEINPTSGIAHTEYGYYLFYRDGKQDEGMRLLVKGASLDKSNPRTHRLLGDVLSQSGTKFYNLNKAQQELRKAIALDASYAAPHYSLATLYTYLRRFEEANRELSVYLSLVPESATSSEAVTSLRSELQKHLR